ncbi:MAG: hypothetical protein AAF847_00130 [Bacteroidota bacterium]
MTEQTIQRLYKAIKHYWKKDDAFFSAIFGLKSSRGIRTSSAGMRYKQGIVRLVELLDHQRPWFKCEKCGYYNTDREVSNQENGIACVKCGHQIHQE